MSMCRGPAPVDPGWFEGGGMASASLEKYIFNYRYRERLETDSVAKRLVEKKRLNNLDYWNSIHAPDGNSARKMEARKKRYGGISLSRNWSNFFILGFAYILLLHIGMNTESCGGQQFWPLTKSGASHKCIKKVLGVLHHLLAMRPADILWSFLSDNQKTYFFQACFFLNQAPPSK